MNFDGTFGDLFVFNISISAPNLGKKIQKAANEKKLGQERARAQRRQRY